MIPCSAVPEDAYAVDASYMGAPTVSIEKLDSSQAEAAAAAVLKVPTLTLLMCMLAKDNVQRMHKGQQPQEQFFCKACLQRRCNKQTALSLISSMEQQVSVMALVCCCYQL